MFVAFIVFCMVVDSMSLQERNFSSRTLPGRFGFENRIDNSYYKLWLQLVLVFVLLKCEMLSYFPEGITYLRWHESATLAVLL